MSVTRSIRREGVEVGVTTLRESEIGAQWEKETQDGKEYMTGNINLNGEKVSLVLFRNRFKDDDLKPDFRIYKREPLPVK